MGPMHNKELDQSIALRLLKGSLIMFCFIMVDYPMFLHSLSTLNDFGHLVRVRAPYDFSDSSPESKFAFLDFTHGKLGHYDL